MKKSHHFYFIYMLVLSFILMSCNKSVSLTNDMVNREPIVVKVPYSYSNIELPEGDSGDNTFMTRYIEDKLGYQIQYSWETSGEEQYRSTLDLAIRSKDIPDVFIVNRTQLKELVAQNLIANLFPVYEQYASDLVRSIYDATAGQALAEATINNQLFGLPNVAILADAPTYVWIREDWLKQLKLEPPKSLEDISTIVKAFITEDPDQNGLDDTIGIPVDPTLIYQNKTGVHGLNSVFAAFNSFPQHYYINDEGSVVYGSIQAETKEALTLLQEWYKEGILDQQFLLRKEPSMPVQQNQAGVMFAPWWAPFWPLASSVAMDTKAEWGVYQAPVNKYGSFKTLASPLTDRYLVVRKGYEHPEAAMELLNLITGLERMVGDEDEQTRQIREQAAVIDVQLRNYFPFDLLLDDPHGVTNRYYQLEQLLAGELEESLLTQEMKQLYALVKREFEAPRKDMEAWSTTNAYLLGGKISTLSKKSVETINLDPFFDEFTQSPPLLELEMEYFTKIITGELSIDAFDEFVQKWFENGGITILKELNLISNQ